MTQWVAYLEWPRYYCFIFYVYSLILVGRLLILLDNFRIKVHRCYSSARCDLRFFKASFTQSPLWTLSVSFSRPYKQVKWYSICNGSRSTHYPDHGPVSLWRRRTDYVDLQSERKRRIKIWPTKDGPELVSRLLDQCALIIEEQYNLFSLG